MNERHGQRPDTPADRPAPAITAKARTARWVETNQDSVQADGTKKRYSRRVTSPSPSVTTQVGLWRYRSTPMPNSAQRGMDEPAPTVMRGNACDWITEPDEPTDRVTVTEAAILQSVRPDYPWHGFNTSRYTQIGNMVPPLLAVAILGHLLNVPQWQQICRDWHRRDGDA